MIDTVTGCQSKGESGYENCFHNRPLSGGRSHHQIASLLLMLIGDFPNPSQL